jgi:predicted nucleotidyltransferase
MNDTIIEKITELIKQQFVPSRIILFGSYARNEAGKDSDLDLIIVEDRAFDQNRSKIRETAAIWRALAAIQISKDILLYSEEEYLRFKHTRNHVVYNAVKEGRALYGCI